MVVKIPRFKDVLNVMIVIMIIRVLIELSMIPYAIPEKLKF